MAGSEWCCRVFEPGQSPVVMRRDDGWRSRLSVSFQGKRQALGLAHAIASETMSLTDPSDRLPVSQPQPCFVAHT